MNSYSHALPFLDNPYFAVGTCLPDWLGVVDRKCRVREGQASKFVETKSDACSKTDLAIAEGIIQHHRDDRWFHQTVAFVTLNIDFSERVRRIYDGEKGFRPGLFGHIVIELLLDDYLSARFPGTMQRLYDLLASIDKKRVQDVVNQIATRPTDGLVFEIGRFLDERYLFDYADDRRLIYRMNRVLERVKLEPFDDRILAFLPEAREDVQRHAPQLLARYPLTPWETT